ncbi:MAG: DedA family protein [Candidatus Pacebacteria bacterium]|nr:DedA family protein [Candidatus Paceibacterota bacterium]MBP9843235.1 DedA family protein [Candidatus Paceibacterota bacterium]
MITDEIQEIEKQYEKEVEGLVKKSGQLLQSKYGLWVLGAITFVDSALAFPGPVDPFLGAYIMANRSRAVLALFVTVCASVVGGVMLYLLAEFFTEQILTFFAVQSETTFSSIVETFDKGTFTISFLGAFTPIPYGFVAIAAGALKGNIFMFILGSLLGRSIRYGVVAYLTYNFGERALTIAKENLTFLSIAAIGLAALYLLFRLYF